MRYCNCCGHELPKGASFCAFCGTNYEIQIDYEDCKHSSFWIRNYKILLWVIFGLICFSGVLSAVFCFTQIDNIGVSMFFIGILSLVCFFILAFYSICLTMIFLEMAEDIRTISINLETLKYRKS